MSPRRAVFGVVWAALGLAACASRASAVDAVWSEVTTSNAGGPSDNFTAILDPVNDRKLLFGGMSSCSSPSPSNQVVTLDLATRVWSSPTPDGAESPDRADPVSIYDPTRQRMVTFGGGYSFTLNDTWELLLPPGGTMTWREITTLDPPIPRTFPVCVYDPVRDRMLLFGGAPQSGPASTNETWALDFADSTWHLLATVGTPPSPRFGAAGIYDPNGDRLVIYGATYGQTDTWELSLSGTPTWTQLASTGPPTDAISPTQHAILDATRHRMLFFVGPDVWSFDLLGPPAWTQLVLGGTPPPDDQAPVYDAARDRALVETTSCPRFGILHRTFALELSISTPVLIALSKVEAAPDRVSLSWSVSAGIVGADLERRTVGTGWARIASLLAGRDGQLNELDYQDTGVMPGTRYGYRLADAGPSGPVMSSEVWVDVPRQAALSIGAVMPNPNVGRFALAFSLTADGLATLEVFDPGGRRVSSREVGSLGVGQHRIDLDLGSRLPSGIYCVRLTQGGQRALARALIVR